MIQNPLRRIFRGATALLAGSRGLVPAPAAGDNTKLLHGDGTWKSVTNASAATVAESLAGAESTKFNTPAGGNARALLGDLSRAIGELCVSDGATSGRGIVWTLGTAGAFGGLPVSWPFEFDVPTSNPSTNALVFYIGPNGTSATTTDDWALIGFLDTSGQLIVVQRGSSSGPDYRLLSYTGFRSAYAGQRVRGMAVFASPNTTTAPAIYINGPDGSASFVLTTNGTPPNWIPTALSTTKFVSGLNWPAGRFVPHAPILGALTAAEVLEWTQTGRLPTWCEVQTGSVVPFYSSNFSAGADGFISVSGSVVTGNVDAINGQDDWLRAERSTTGQLQVTKQIFGLAARLSSASGRVQIRARIYNASATPRYFGAGFSGYGGDAGAPAPVLVNAGSQVDFVITRTLRSDEVMPSAELRFITQTAGGATDATVPAGDLFYFKTVEVVVFGPLFKPVIQPCRIIDDAGSNGIPGVISSGITPITEKKEWRIRAAVDMTTTGNKQLLSAALFESPQNQALDSVDVDCAGAPTFSLNDGTTLTKYSASTAFSAGRTRLALASNYPADSAKTGLYAYVTSAHASSAAEKLTIRGHRTD